MSQKVFLTQEMDISWRYASGDAMQRFTEGLKQRRIEALHCRKCGRRYLPPRPFCGVCYLRLTDWVPVSDEGSLEAWTVVYLPIIDSRTGLTRAGPYGMGLIRLDGADTTLNHYLSETEPGRLSIGMRVKAIWREDLHGAVDDILHFEVVR